jgi:hypothetical protein
MALDEDFAEFMADFGVSAKVGATVITGIFDNAEADTFGIVANTRSVLTVATEDIPAASVGTTVVVDGTTYTIAELQPDGTGITRLMLK